MTKSPIDMIPMRITGGVCPVCGRHVRVENRLFAKHFKRYGSRRKVDICINSEKPVPEEWR